MASIRYIEAVISHENYGSFGTCLLFFPLISCVMAHPPLGRQGKCHVMAPCLLPSPPNLISDDLSTFDLVNTFQGNSAFFVTFTLLWLSFVILFRASHFQVGQLPAPFIYYCTCSVLSYIDNYRYNNYII